ncbi:MAG: protocatechuate 3,4-dioxygenase subunit beta, partial [Gemmatimonadetes bacterium]|nr:protocatechuate 3,4-dioxygenase subunit beta [Gemmatimonadota bacterium]
MKGHPGPVADHPPYLHEPYASTVRRAPQQRLVPLTAGLAESTGPVFGQHAVGDLDHDLTRNAVRTAAPLGERIVVTGRVLDGTGHPVQRALLEIWQANAAGRYIHKKDQHDAPLDPNFTGTGRCLTDDDGRYRLTTIRPGAYPWLNHENAWRPPHIHFSIFGRSFSQRLVTQMYFPGDPLLTFDPIYNSIPDEAARKRLVARFDLSVTQPEWALGFHFDLVVNGARQTP